MLTYRIFVSNESFYTLTSDCNCNFSPSIRFVRYRLLS